MSSTFPVEKAFKQGEASSPQLINFTKEYSIRMVQRTYFGIDINVSHQILVYAKGVNPTSDDIKPIEKFNDVIKCL